MTILLLDDDYIIIEQLKCLTQLDNNWKIVKHDEVSYDKVDLIIIDIFNNKYKHILQDILEVNPQIRTITVSDRLSSKNPNGCEYCDSNYNRIRLIKPIHLKQLFDTINNFDEIPMCPLKDAFTNIEKLIPILLKQFKDLLYDEDSKTVSSTSDLESKEHTMQILSFLTLLDQNQIEYTLLNENSIQIKI